MVSSLVPDLYLTDHGKPKFRFYIKLILIFEDHDSGQTKHLWCRFGPNYHIFAKSFKLGKNEPVLYMENTEIQRHRA